MPMGACTTSSPGKAGLTGMDIEGLNGALYFACTLFSGWKSSRKKKRRRGDLIDRGKSAQKATLRGKLIISRLQVRVLPAPPRIPTSEEISRPCGNLPPNRPTCDVSFVSAAALCELLWMFRCLCLCAQNSVSRKQGHPVGATGTIILVKLLYELKRTGGRYGLATMCIGGGQGIALIVER